MLSLNGITPGRDQHSIGTKDRSIIATIITTHMPRSDINTADIDPRLNSTKILCRLLENYGVGVAEIAPEVGISSSGVSKILMRTLSI
jgi:hypothetical protein